MTLDNQKALDDLKALNKAENKDIETKQKATR